MAKNSSPNSNTSGAPNRRKAPSRTKTKKQLCIDLLSRPRGASRADLQRATGWQPHSVRGFLSGTVNKLEGVSLVSEQDGRGERRYRLTRPGQTDQR